MKNKKCMCLILALSLSTSTLVMADVEQDVINAQTQYVEYQKGIDAMTAEVVKYNSEIEEFISKIDSAESELESLNIEIEQNELRIKSLEEELVKTEELKGNRLRSYHKSGGLDYLTLLFDSENFNDLLDKVQYTTKLMALDKDLMNKIEESKAEVASLVKKQEENKKSIKSLLIDLESDKKDLEIKTREQELVLQELMQEQETFGKEVLEVAEMNLLAPQLEVIEDSSSSVSSLQSSVNQLIAIRDNQLTMDAVISKVNDYISQANSIIEEKQAAIAQQEALAEQANASRGDVSYSGNGSASSLVDYAYQFIGLPYVWGAVGPNTFDCSGFTSYVYRHAAGIEISRTTYTQINVGTPVAYSDMQPGDLVFTYGNEHVGIYVGGGQYINATYPGSTIRVTPVTNFYAARRVLY